jgi:hypothetical protein
MDYIIYVSQRNKIVGLSGAARFNSIPRVLANEKPVRFGRSRLQRHMSYEIMRPMETTTRTQGSPLEPREVYSLNVMLQKTRNTK